MATRRFTPFYQMRFNSPEFINIFSDLALKGLAFLTVPLYAYYMTSEELGTYGEWLSIYFLIYSFVSFGFPTLFQVKLSKIESNIFEFKKSALMLSLLSACVISVFGYFFWNSYLFYLNSAILVAITFFYVELCLVLERNQKSKRYVFIQLAHTLCFYIFPLLVLIVYSASAFMRVASTTAFCLLLLLFLVKHLNKSFRAYFGSAQRLNYQDLHYAALLKFGMPFLLIGLFSFMKFGLDIQLMQANGLHLKNVGTYTLAFQLMTILTGLQAILLRNLSPNLYRSINNNITSNGFDILVAKVSGFTVVIAFMLLTGVYVIESTIVSEKYPGLTLMCAGLFLSAALMGYNQLYLTKVLHKEQSSIFLYASCASGLAHFAFSYILLRIGSSYGVSLSYVGSSVVFSICVYLYLRNFNYV